MNSCLKVMKLYHIEFVLQILVNFTLHANRINERACEVLFEESILFLEYHFKSLELQQQNFQM